MEDVVKHTHDLGFIEACKIAGDDTGTHIEAMETITQVVLMVNYITQHLI